MKNNSELRVAGFFAGVGGIERGFDLAGFNSVWSNELDQQASKTYATNHASELVVGDIGSVDSADVPTVEVIVGGFPCQAFSVAGHRKGFQDERGEVFFELARIIREKKPEAIFIENVKNLKGHDGGNTFKVIMANLEDAGYHLSSKVLNAAEYGNVPQSRERIYIVGFRDEGAKNRFVWPEKIPLTKKISDIVDLDKKVDDKFYYTAETFPRYAEIVEEITDPSTVYQWRRQYVRKNKSNLFPTLTANMGTGGHNVPLVLTKHGIRKLTPEECFAVQGFEDIRIPEGMARSHLYKQAGNSVVVPVIERIARQMKIALAKG
ncbi:DNA cytosine methyltransferase [Glutamicibacter ardleyensis]|uniref:DNA cytosine methyltransferase n=1 Tax=Glutamicibacter ardleyensis TaxID=225894 RepID=UPI003FD1F8A9